MGGMAAASPPPLSAPTSLDIIAAWVALKVWGILQSFGETVVATILSPIGNDKNKTCFCLVYLISIALFYTRMRPSQCSSNILLILKLKDWKEVNCQLISKCPFGVLVSKKTWNRRVVALFTTNWIHFILTLLHYFFDLTSF